MCGMPERGKSHIWTWASRGGGGRWCEFFVWCCEMEGVNRVENGGFYIGFFLANISYLSSMRRAWWSCSTSSHMTPLLPATRRKPPILVHCLFVVRILPTSATFWFRICPVCISNLPTSPSQIYLLYILSSEPCVFALAAVLEISLLNDYEYSVTNRTMHDQSTKSGLGRMISFRDEVRHRGWWLRFNG